MTWKIKNIIERIVDDNGDAHHLFNYYEVRGKLISLFGEPKTNEEHEILSMRCKKVMNNMPVFILDKDKHHDYEIKLRSTKRTLKTSQ